MTQLEKDIFYMEFAKHSASKSKDPKTKVGAVLVKDRKILSVGFNGAPRSFPDELVPKEEGHKLIDQKNTFMCHAELNSILNYGGHMKDLKNSTIYVTISPCSKCSIALAQIGVKNVIFLEEYHREEETEASKYILDKCGINYKKFGD